MNCLNTENLNCRLYNYSKQCILYCILCLIFERYHFDEDFHRIKVMCATTTAK